MSSTLDYESRWEKTREDIKILFARRRPEDVCMISLDFASSILLLEDIKYIVTEFNQLKGRWISVESVVVTFPGRYVPEPSYSDTIRDMMECIKNEFKSTITRVHFKNVKLIPKSFIQHTTQMPRLKHIFMISSSLDETSLEDDMVITTVQWSTLLLTHNATTLTEYVFNCIRAGSTFNHIRVTVTALSQEKLCSFLNKVQIKEGCLLHGSVYGMEEYCSIFQSYESTRAPILRIDPVDMIDLSHVETSRRLARCLQGHRYLKHLQFDLEHVSTAPTKDILEGFWTFCALTENRIRLDAIRVASNRPDRIAIEEKKKSIQSLPYGTIMALLSTRDVPRFQTVSVSQLPEELIRKIAEGLGILPESRRFIDQENVDG